MIIVTFNVQYGLGDDGRYDLDRTARAVAGADVIALQEVERWWRRSGDLDEVAEIARHLDTYHWVFGANLDMDAGVRTAEGKPLHRRRQFGNMLLSRWPILSSRNFPLPKHGTLSQHSIQQGLLEGVVDAPGGPLRVYTTHLSHLDAGTRMPQVERVLEVIARAPGEGGAWCGGHPNPSAGWTQGEEPPMPRPGVLTGDLNLEAPSREYARLVGPLSANHGRLAHRAGLVDAWVAAGHDEGEGITCPSKHAEHGPGKRIDHCLVTADLAPAVRRAWIDQACIASDHRPLWVEIEPATG